MSKKVIVRRKQGRKSPAETSMTSIPETVNEAVTEVLWLMSEEDKSDLHSLSADGLSEYHPLFEHITDMIRSTWLGSSFGQPLARDCRRNYGTGETDDEIAFTIIYETWKQLQMTRMTDVWFR